MNYWPDTNESLILRVKDPNDAAAWSTFLAIYRPVVCRMAVNRGLQHADADDLAQQVFLSVARAIENWTSGAGQPPFRGWLATITRNAIVNAITRQKPDAAVGSQSMQDLLNQTPDRSDETAKEVIEQSRMQAFRWAAEQIRREFTPATWKMFWQTSIDERPVADVAAEHQRSTGAVYLARYRVMQRLRKKVTEVSELWSEWE